MYTISTKWVQNVNPIDIFVFHPQRVLKTIWKPHKSKEHSFLHRNYTPTFFSQLQKNIFSIDQKKSKIFSKFFGRKFLVEKIFGRKNNFRSKILIDYFFGRKLFFRSKIFSTKIFRPKNFRKKFEFFSTENFSIKIFWTPMSIQNFPRIPKIAPIKSCGHSKDTEKGPG